MTISEIIEGLTILRPYYTRGGDAYAVGAEHDVLYAFTTDRPVSAEDFAKLRALGWFQTGPGGADDDAIYDPDESWQAFV